MQNLKDDVYSTAAANIARLSKDENTKIGALIVAKDGTPVSWGYNGTVAGFPDEEIPHSREVKQLHYVETAGTENTVRALSSNKYPYMSHAESNAIFFGDRNKLVGATIYITGFPCENCAREIARAGIARVVVRNDTKADASSSVKASNDVSKHILAQKETKLTVDGVHYELRAAYSWEIAEELRSRT